MATMVQSERSLFSLIFLINSYILFTSIVIRQYRYSISDLLPYNLISGSLLLYRHIVLNWSFYSILFHYYSFRLDLLISLGILFNINPCVLLWSVSWKLLYQHMYQYYFIIILSLSYNSYSILYLLPYNSISGSLLFNIGIQCLNGLFIQYYYLLINIINLKNNTYIHNINYKF